jgi:hypothetical protein
MNLTVEETHRVIVKKVLSYVDIALFDFFDCPHRLKYFRRGTLGQAFPPP